MKTRLYSDQNEAAGTMITGTCLVCDYQGVPHRIFCDVTNGKRPSGRHDTEHLRYRLEGVLAVTLTLGPGMPDGLCLKCEKGLCEIESRVRGFRDMHHATKEKYRQLRVAGDAFICDLTRLETRHAEGGSETRTETEARPETETYLPPQPPLPVSCQQVWRGADPRRGEVCLQGQLTPQSAIDTSGVQCTGYTTGMPVRSSPVAAAHRHSVGSYTLDSDSPAAQLSNPTISLYFDSNTKEYCSMATQHRNSISGEVDSRRKVNGNNNSVGSHLDNDNVQESRTEHCNGTDGQSNGGINHANSLPVNHRNSVSGEFRDVADATYSHRLETQCNVSNVDLTHNQQNGSHQGRTYVNGSSVGENSYSDTLDKTCPSPAYYDQSHGKHTGNVCLESGQENNQFQQSAASEQEDDTSGLVLDLTVPRSLPEGQYIEHQTRNIDEGNTNTANQPWRSSNANEGVQSEKNYPSVSRQCGEWESSYHQDKLQVNTTPRSPWASSKAPPPLIHVSQIKKEPIDDDPPSNKRYMSSLDYLQKMPLCIAPIEEGKGVGQDQFYGDSYLREPPHKRYKYERGYGVPNQDPPPPRFPVLNTHVSATLNVTHPGKDVNKRMPGEKTPDSNYNSSSSSSSSSGETVQTTTIQGTIRIPLDQLQNMKTAPANISLMTEATVNSTVVPEHQQQESTHGQHARQHPSQHPSQHQSQHPSQQTQHSAKTPVNMRVATEELRARIPLHKAFLDKVQPSQEIPHGANQRMLDMFRTYGIPIHCLDSNGRPINPGPGNVRHVRKGQQPPEWIRVERLGQGQLGNPQVDINLDLSQPGLEVKGDREQGHRVQGQVHIDKLGSTRQMTSYSWQLPRFNRAVVGQGQGQVQGHGQARFPLTLQHPSTFSDKNMSQGQFPETTPKQMQRHLPMPQGQTQSQQGQTEGQLCEGPTKGQGQQDRGQQQVNEGPSDKEFTIQGRASQGQVQGQVNNRDQGHSVEGQALGGQAAGEGQAVQKTSTQNNNLLDPTQTKAESEEEDEEEDDDDGRPVTEQDVNMGPVISRNESSGRRQLLRPWLEQRLDRGNIPGFQWFDKQRNLFMIPWKHRSKNDWSPDNCTIFMEWALHTGKHRVGMDKPDYCRWKTRLRCAFNQAADIQERKDLNKMKCSEPYKVYEFLSKSEIKPKPPPKPKPQPAGVPGTAPRANSSTHTPTASVPNHATTFQPLQAAQSPKTVEMYTAVAGALMSVAGGPLLHHDRGSPPSALAPSASHQQETAPPTADLLQTSPNTTKMAAAAFPAETISIPVETNNNKFSWDADLDDEGPLVIDLDRTDNVDGGNIARDGQNQALKTGNRLNSQTQNGHLQRQHMTSRDGPYLCDLCGQCFHMVDALIEHKDKIHRVCSDTSKAPPNGMVNQQSGSTEGNHRNPSRTSSDQSHPQNCDSNGPIRDLDTNSG